MAMTLNAADTMILLNVANQGVHLWDIRKLYNYPLPPVDILEM